MGEGWERRSAHIEPRSVYCPSSYDLRHIAGF
jgi:hypothetical protein